MHFQTWRSFLVRFLCARYTENTEKKEECFKNIKFAAKAAAAVIIRGNYEGERHELKGIYAFEHVDATQTR